ncbi:recombinase family protein [Papillibacter cinnamivorans]|uniref:Site-specific DNA recombinase n=1 Tax=Papillibacter cinnamivorans DSM 12816 TaxID=1122930 RepID=A0A1W1YZM8_9FIRM|nr:recombinase family protein [Papillibacter cinnamivorans]SMC41148.1 Site-specific DNA recombinase [Papillibacter cinnamivorans DSM 12816]
MIYGYARVSTTGQSRDGNSLESQTAQLIASGCPAENIVSEAYTGTKMQRKQFTALLDHLESGDTLKICKLDRYARTTIEGVQTAQELLDRGINLHILNMGLIDNTPTGKLILTIMLAFAQYERDMIVERTQAGKDVARKRKGYREGRPQTYTEDRIKTALSMLDNHSYSEVERLTGISKSTLIRRKPA